MEYEFSLVNVNRGFAQHYSFWKQNMIAVVMGWINNLPRVDGGEGGGGEGGGLLQETYIFMIHVLWKYNDALDPTSIILPPSEVDGPSNLISLSFYYLTWALRPFTN